jgi:uncharacterized coiled-coil protein SlyX
MNAPDKEKTEQRLKELEATLDEQRRLVATLRSTLSQLQTDLDHVHGKIQEISKKNVTTCKSCQTEFDLFSHHYSIGLFDNIVFVKCPHCHTAMPVDPKEGVKRE